MPANCPLEIVSVASLLESLGFKKTGNPVGDFTIDFGNLVLSAVPCTDEYFRPVVAFSGVYRDARTLREIAFNIPDKVESAPQVKAWIACGIGEWFHPAMPFDWLEEGRQMRELLPWEREMRAYRDRPQISVQRAWFRLATKDLRDAAERCDETAVCRFMFDGRILTIEFDGRLIPLPASGNKPWEHQASIPLKRLTNMPRRWMTDPVCISLWQDQIFLGRYVFSLAGSRDG